MTLGKEGEELACRHLQAQGFRILERNFTLKVGEIDIIAQREALLVFCEVKARKSRKYGRPFEAVTPFKQQRIRRVAEGFLAMRQVKFRDARFDVISIDNGEVEHLENAF